MEGMQVEVTGQLQHRCVTVEETVPGESEHFGEQILVTPRLCMNLVPQPATSLLQLSWIMKTFCCSLTFSRDSYTYTSWWTWAYKKGRRMYSPLRLNDILLRYLTMPFNCVGYIASTGQLWKMNWKERWRKLQTLRYCSRILLEGLIKNTKNITRWSICGPKFGSGTLRKQTDWPRCLDLHAYIKLVLSCKIWGFHGGDYEEYRLLWCGAV
jgi:hypothetical protein